MQDTDEMLQLRDGRYVASPEHSEKLAIIKQSRPESPDESSDGYAWDESGMAELFAKCYANDTRYCAEAKSWYTYDGGRWVRDVEGLLVSGKIREFVRLMSLYCGEITDDERRKAYLKFVTRMGDRRFRDRLMRDAQTELKIPAAEFDTNPNLINCKNGTYDLETGVFSEHNHADLVTMQTNCEYTRQYVSCPRWERFISEITSAPDGNGGYTPDPAKADYLQRALGYSLLGVAREECMFILYGKTTRNGKSTLLDAICDLLGDYATVAPVELICRNSTPTNAEAPSPVLARLKGRRVVTMNESADAGKLDESLIKQLTGGEKITARELRQEPITYLPQFCLWLSCNDLPAVRDKSVFASDRLRVIEFNRFFSEAERDDSLKDFFHTPEAQRGIFAWLVAGYAKYKERGLKMNDDMKKVINQYAKDNDIILQFLEERCERNNGSSTKGSALYDTYKVWAKSNGYYVCSSKKFIAGVRQHPEFYWDLRDVRHAVFFDGLAIVLN